MGSIMMNFSRTEISTNALCFLLSSGLVVAGAFGIQGTLSPLGVSVIPIVAGGITYVSGGCQGAEDLFGPKSQRDATYCAFQLLLMTIGAATLILGSISQAGHISPIVMSATGIGLGGASILTLALMIVKIRKPEPLFSFVLETKEGSQNPF